MRGDHVARVISFIQVTAFEKEQGGSSANWSQEDGRALFRLSVEYVQCFCYTVERSDRRHGDDYDETTQTKRAYLGSVLNRKGQRIVTNRIFWSCRNMFFHHTNITHPPCQCRTGEWVQRSQLIHTSDIHTQADAAFGATAAAGGASVSSTGVGRRTQGTHWDRFTDDDDPAAAARWAVDATRAPVGAASSSWLNGLVGETLQLSKEVVIDVSVLHPVQVVNWRPPPPPPVFGVHRGANSKPVSVPIAPVPALQRPVPLCSGVLTRSYSSAPTSSVSQNRGRDGNTDTASRRRRETLDDEPHDDDEGMFETTRGGEGIGDNFDGFSSTNLLHEGRNEVALYVNAPRSDASGFSPAPRKVGKLVIQVDILFNEHKLRPKPWNVDTAHSQKSTLHREGGVVAATHRSVKDEDEFDSSDCPASMLHMIVRAPLPLNLAGDWDRHWDDLRWASQRWDVPHCLAAIKLCEGALMELQIQSNNATTSAPGSGSFRERPPSPPTSPNFQLAQKMYSRSSSGPNNALMLMSGDGTASFNTSDLLALEAMEASAVHGLSSWDGSHLLWESAGGRGARATRQSADDTTTDTIRLHLVYRLLELLVMRTSADEASDKDSGACIRFVVEATGTMGFLWRYFQVRPGLASLPL